MTDMWDFVRAKRAPQHTCHWPGCHVEVTPRFWGCRRHWLQLPKWLRDEIWAAYVPGQEVMKTPTARYLEAADMAKGFAILKTRGYA